MFCIGFLSDKALSIGLCPGLAVLTCLALHQLTYLPAGIPEVRLNRFLCFAERVVLLVPFARTATMLQKPRILCQSESTSFMHCRHLYSAFQVGLLRSAPSPSAAK